VLTAQTQAAFHWVETPHVSIRASECWIAKSTVPQRQKRNCGWQASEAPAACPFSAGRHPR